MNIKFDTKAPLSKEGVNVLYVIFILVFISEKIKLVVPDARKVFL